MNINEKLQSVLKSKNAIKDALVEKGVTMDGKKFSEYADAIASIQTGGGVIESFSGTKEYKSFIDAEELEYMNVRGALLWLKDGAAEGDDGYLLASNGDSTEAGYWNPNDVDMN